MPEHISTLSVAAKNSKQRMTTGSCFIPLVKRIHFYIGLFVGPFLLLAALSGILYALKLQIESHLYARQLYNDSRGTVLPLQRQISAAKAFAPSHAVLSAVRPSPVDGENTRVLFDVAGLQPAERLAVFVDPVTEQLHGMLMAPAAYCRCVLGWINFIEAYYWEIWDVITASLRPPGYGLLRWVA